MHTWDKTNGKIVLKTPMYTAFNMYVMFVIIGLLSSVEEWEDKDQHNAVLSQTNTELLEMSKRMLKT